MGTEDEGFVRFVDVQKTYDGETLVIKGLSFSIRKGEFLTLLGPSGSGKTTTLMMLAGFEMPTAGEIELEGQRLTRQPPYRRNFGMVFQDYSLFPHMTVAENVAFPLTVRKRAREDVRTRVAQALDMVRLGDFAGRRPAQLSGGQQQRVALARALVFQPRLVLMDEPLGALDKQLREEMQLEIKHIQKSLGITAVYVTHDQQEALTMSDRIAVFRDGSILQLDTPAELYMRPRSAFVAGFIGESNRLIGRVVALEGGRCSVELGDGLCVTATSFDLAGIGSRALLTVRPERVIIDAGPDGTPNHFRARVEEVIYHGDHRRARLTLAGDSNFMIKIPTSGSERELAVGETLPVRWSVEDCRAFDAG
jgi:putative spermidine/putrescine transport system ATP-binding protein